MAEEPAFDPDRFLQAQSGVFDTALRELSAGRKRTHWMWFVFPQLRGLGRSETAARFGLPDLRAARAYLDHEILGPRLVRAAETVRDGPSDSLRDLFGSPDDLKFVSSMTLFEAAAPKGPFTSARERFGARPDGETLRRLGLSGSPPAAPGTV